jgi:dipeptidyl aminopeptidase/acylaminoacyl peptidase
VEVTIGKDLLADAQDYTLENPVKDYQTPTLILHGTLDDAVPFQDSVEFAQKSRGRPMDLVLIAGGDHRLTDYKAALFDYIRTFCTRIKIF